MLPIEELVRFAEDLDDRHHHPLATAAADRWGLAPPVFIRSSASHVVVARDVVLRLRPAQEAPTLLRAARAARTWHHAGGPFVDCVESRAGRLVEPVDRYAVMALAVAPGPTLEESDDVPGQAAAWGEALARLHAATHAFDVSELPVVAPLDLPRGPEVFGVLHGDPEADNVVLTAGGPVLVDPDEVRLGWFAADVAFALRDWSERRDVVDPFLAGYRRARPFTAAEESWLPLLAAAAEQEQLTRLTPHLAAVADPEWPQWAHDLDARLKQMAAPEAPDGPGV